MKIVIDDKIPYLRGVLEPYAQVVYLSGREIDRTALMDADALLVRTRTCCDERLLAGTKVSVVATATIGTDHIDKRWCAENNIEVFSAPGCNAGGVLQWVAAQLAQLAKRKEMKPVATTIGVVGVGSVGSLIAKYAHAWGFRVLRSDPPRERAEGLGRAEGYVSLDELAAQSDIVTFHVPLTYNGDHPTHYLAGEEFFGLLRRGAVVINASRGGVVEEKSLLRHIKAGDCLACLDTWEGEPYIDNELLAQAFVSTTHIAGYSVQGKANATAAVIAAVVEHFNMPLKGWYPQQVSRVERRELSFAEMCCSIDGYCDVMAETALLKSNITAFESLREEYIFREEYF